VFCHFTKSTTSQHPHAGLTADLGNQPKIATINTEGDMETASELLDSEGS
jgi:hypothetical protein